MKRFLAILVTLLPALFRKARVSRRRISNCPDAYVGILGWLDVHCQGMAHGPI